MCASGPSPGSRLQPIAGPFFSPPTASPPTPPLRCPGLTQVFTRPSELTGVIYEFIERGEFGFCKDNVRALMEGTRGIR
ncbi:MAG: hypothetical protein LW700_15695 [Gemmataceae bacterium]|nr:hypothetical protein [Gemmataceae bacterium]